MIQALCFCCDSPRVSLKEACSSRPEEKAMVLATEGATQGAILATSIKKAAWRSKPSWFVIASNDRAISPEQEASTAKRMGSKTLTLPSSHVPLLSHPGKVADFVIEAASSVNSGIAASS
jgi:hypothetical protein